MKSKFLLAVALFFGLTYKMVPYSTIFAHPEVLDVTYDVCQPVENQEGEDELWYLLYRPFLEYDEYLHLSEDTTIIRYYFSDYAKDDLDYTWTTDVSKEMANEIQTAFIKSLCKWNDVFYYTYDLVGGRIKRQLITIEEGTKENYNLLIYPIDATAPYIAATAPLSEGTVIDTHTPRLRHIHYDKWYMNVNLHYFYQNQDITAQLAYIHKERTGMHELGHVLGLRDVDAYCALNQHHEELLMGYGDGVNYQLGPTYQDIAGIAITRGLHTDENHIWMKRENMDNTIDLICTICNGIMCNVKNFEDHMITYQSCNHYGEDSSHMLLVASFGNVDYFKCQGCRRIDTIEFVEEYDINKDNSKIEDTKIVNSLSKMYYKLNVDAAQCCQIIAHSYETLRITLYNEKLEIIEPQIQMKEASDITKDREYVLSKGVYYLEIENAKSNKDMVSLDIHIKNPMHLILGYSIKILLNVYNAICQNDFRLDQFISNENKQEDSSFLSLQNVHIIKKSKEEPISKKECPPYQKVSHSMMYLQNSIKSIYLDNRYASERTKNQYKRHFSHKGMIVISTYSTISSEIIRKFIHSMYNNW